jgi:ornithine cyclodeaminase/alanine dehydrogenase-like protein (mu-crystallin family)
VALFLTETDVRELLPMGRALECVEASLVAQGNARAVNRSRERILLPHLSLHYVAGALPELQHLGMKIYTVTPNDVRFLVLLVRRREWQIVVIDAGRPSGAYPHRSC